MLVLQELGVTPDFGGTKRVLLLEPARFIHRYLQDFQV